MAMVYGFGLVERNTVEVGYCLGLVHRIGDHALVVEAVQGIPIEALPGPPVMVAGQE